MVRRCQWGLCKSDSRYPERVEGVRFIPFPQPRKNLEKCRRWIKACGRPHTQLNTDIVDRNYNIFICTKHFADGGPSDSFPDPYPVDNANHSVITLLRPPPKKRISSKPIVRKRKRLSDRIENAQENSARGNNEKLDVVVEGKMNELVNPSVSALELLALAAENKTLQEQLARQLLENDKLRQQKSLTVQMKVPSPNIDQG